MKSTPAEEDRTRSVVFFDGVCVLCHRSVGFLARADRGRRLRFAPLQGETFRSMDLNLPPVDSIVYVRAREPGDRRVYVRSDAILRILRDLGGVWTVVSWLRIVPRVVRDPVYDWIARHRYAWFGRHDACRVPTSMDDVQVLP